MAARKAAKVAAIVDAAAAMAAEEAAPDGGIDWDTAIQCINDDNGGENAVLIDLQASDED